MIKFIDILNEGTLQLTQEERDQIEKIISKIIKIISGKTISTDTQKAVFVDFINYEFADKSKGKVAVFVSNDNLKTSGYFQTNDPNNLTDNSIVIQQHAFKQYFGIINKGYSVITGDKNVGIEELRKTLKHELIHAKDPALNHHLLKEPYDINKEEIYYKSWTEFQTMTGQFFESITSGVDRIMSKNPSEENIRKIEKALNEILNFYAGKTKNLSQDTFDFIQGTDKRNLFQYIMKNITDVVLKITLGQNMSTSLGYYFYYISQIKQYNPEGYKEFLKDLYKTIDKAKDNINDALNSTRKSIPTRADNVPTNITLKEMKKPLNEEFRRMQKLAGIQLNEESQTDPIAEKDAEQGLKQALAALKSGTSNIKPSSQDKEIKEGVALTLGLIAGAPGLISLLGKAVNFISAPFQNIDNQNKGTIVGNALKNLGHEWEDAYIGIIGDMLKKIYPDKYQIQDVHDKKSALYDAAHGIYATILIGAAISSGVGAVQAHSQIVAGLEGGLSAFKSKEIIDLAKKIAAA